MGSMSWGRFDDGVGLMKEKRNDLQGKEPDIVISILFGLFLEV